MRPAIFVNLEIEAARERAIADHKMLLVDATAEWCGPCKMMDRTTWIDPDVVAWFGEHAIAIQIDVDAQKDVARELRIEAMPTIVAFVEGKEFDRIVGAKKPKDLLAWLEAVLRGETSVGTLERSAREQPTNMDARMDYARQLARTGRYAEALTEHVWLWEHMLEHVPAMYGVRMSFFASDLARLVHAYEPARAAITVLRDRAAPAATGPVDVEAFRDWGVLTRVLGEKSGALEWFDSLPASDRDRARPLLKHDIIPLLIEAERWADAGALYADPVATIELSAEQLTHLVKHELPPDVVERFRQSSREEAAQIVRALRAAGRVDDAEAAARRACELDPSDEMRQALSEVR